MITSKKKFFLLSNYDEYVFFNIDVIGINFVLLSIFVYFYKKIKLKMFINVHKLKSSLWMVKTVKSTALERHVSPKR